MVNIFFGGFVDLADGFLGGRVDGLKGIAVLAFDEFVVDEAAMTGISLRSRAFGGGGKMSSIG